MPLPGARDRVVELLKERFVENDLSIAEFEQRVALAHQARSRAELDPLIADLVPGASHVPASGPAGDTGYVGYVGYEGPVTKHGKIVAILSNNERRGPMDLPQRLEIVAILGNVELDLSNASIARGVTEIDISAVFGNVQVTLPMDVRVESAGNAFLGSFDHRSNDFTGQRQSGERTIRVTGHAVFGSVTIDAMPTFAPARFPADSGSPRRLG